MFCQHGFLRHSLRVARGQGVDTFHKKVLARFQNAVVHVPCGVVASDGDFHTTEHMARVDLVLEQKCGGPRHRFAIQDCPVNGCRTAVLRQQRSVKVDGAQAGEIPNHFWQHSEGDHHPQVRRPRFKGGPEFGRLQLLRLGQGEAMLFRHNLHFGSAQGATSAGRSVGCRHDTNNLVVRFQQPFQTSGGEPGGSKENNAQGRGVVCHALQRSNNPFKNRAGRDALRANPGISGTLPTPPGCRRSTPSRPAKSHGWASAIAGPTRRRSRCTPTRL